VMLPDVACVIEKFRQLIDLRKAALRSHGRQRDKRNCTKVVHSRGCAVESVGNRLREARTSEIVSSAERESQQARAQQHKAGSCQREESIGNQIVIVHDKPAV
jgi:hypothetical protein